jgi:NDP-sugar pyrophosphorylase family protein
MITTAVILAAGRGSRLRAITQARSKALAPVVGMPLISRIMASLREAGIERFHIVTAPHDEELQRHVAAEPHVVTHIQEKPLGSGDALRSCQSRLRGNFLVCACDSVVEPSEIRSLIETARIAEGAMALAVMEVSPEVSLETRSVVVLDGTKVLDIIEKPGPNERKSNVTSLPLYILNEEIFVELQKLLPSTRGEYELPVAIRNLIGKGRLAISSRVTQRDDVTALSDLLKLNIKVLRGLSPDVQVAEGVFIPPTATVVGPVFIDPGVSVGEGVTLGPFVYLERGSVIEAGVRLERTVVTRGSRVNRDTYDAVVIT